MRGTDLEMLRAMLKSWTWGDVCRSTGNPKHGIWFYGRLGMFLNKPCVAACSRDLIVAMRSIDQIGDYIPKKYALKAFIDGKFSNGLTLLERDLSHLGIAPNDQVIQDQDEV